MAVSKTTRLGLTRWTEDTDPWSRDDWDDDNAALELLAVGALEGLASARPAASAANARMFYRATNTGVLSYSTGAAWVTISRPESYSLIYGPSDSNNPINEVGWQPAGVEMAYCYADSPSEAGSPNPPTNLPSWLTVQTNPANAQPGKLTLAKGARYVLHVEVKFEDLDVTDGLWALGYTATEGSGALAWTPGNRPSFVLPPYKHTAELAAIMGTSVTALTLQLNATVGAESSAGADIEFLPVVYLAPSSDPDTGGSSQRQIQAVSITVVRHVL